MEDMPESVLVGSLQKFSVEDGPGIRTTVFLKGCPLSCKWCHNPELIDGKQQLIQSPNNCIGCGILRRHMSEKRSIHRSSGGRGHRQSEVRSVSYLCRSVLRKGSSAGGKGHDRGRDHGDRSAGSRLLRQHWRRHDHQRRRDPPSQEFCERTHPRGETAKHQRVHGYQRLWRDTGAYGNGAYGKRHRHPLRHEVHRRSGTPGLYWRQQPADP